MRCKLCGGELEEWVKVSELGEESEKPRYKVIWECSKCDRFYLVIYEAVSITPLVRK